MQTEEEFFDEVNPVTGKQGMLVYRGGRFGHKECLMRLQKPKPEPGAPASVPTPSGLPALA